jgi:hypothetical protein
MTRAKQRNEVEFSVDFLMDEWGMATASRRLQGCLRKVLRELVFSTLMILRREPKLEIVVDPEGSHSAWAYFPVYPRRLVAQRYKPKPATRVLLVLSEKHCEDQSTAQYEKDLRHHLGHTLLYLRSPKAPNGCAAADKEWRDNLREGNR